MKIYPECQGGCRSHNGCQGDLHYVVGTARSGIQIMNGRPIYYCEGVIKREEIIGYTFTYHQERSKAIQVDQACTCDIVVLIAQGCQCGGN